MGRIWRQLYNLYCNGGIPRCQNKNFKISCAFYMHNIVSKFIRKTNKNNHTHTFYVSPSLSMYIAICVYMYYVCVYPCINERKYKTDHLSVYDMYYVCIYACINERKYKNISFKKILSSI